MVANKQTNGKGKGDRKWIGEDNENLYFSLKIDASNKNFDYSQLSFLSGLAIKNSITKYNKTNNSILLKWPNDLLINEKKVSGILLEYDLLYNYLVIGVGVNIKSFPKTNTIFNATSLFQENIFVDKDILLKDFLYNFDFLLKKWYEFGFSYIREDWLKNCYKLKKEIKVNNIVGIFEDLDIDGTLILKTKEGTTKIYSGDIF